MRALLAVVGGCVALVALLAWQLRIPRQNEHGRTLSHGVPAAAVPAARNEVHPAETVESPAMQASASPATAFSGKVEPAADSAEEVDTTAGVRWAADVNVGESARRLQTARDALAADPDSDGALDEALLAANAEQQWYEALKLAARKVERRPDDVEARVAHATLLLRLRLWAQAVEELKRVVAAAPSNAAAWFNRAVAERELGRLSDARASWDRCLDISPDSAEARARRGELLLDMGEWSAAAEDFRAVMAAEPDSVDAAMNLSLALAKLGRPADARSTVSSMLDAHPHHVPALNRMAQLCWLLSRTDGGDRVQLRREARGWCEQSLALDAAQPDASALLKRIDAEDASEE